MAFIAPGLVKAAVKGWLPPGIGSRRRKMPKLEGQPRRNGIFGRGDRPPKRTRYRYRRPDTKKKVTGKAANRGFSSRVSGYLEISRLRGGCDRDRTCDPYHVKVVSIADYVGKSAKKRP